MFEARPLTAMASAESMNMEDVVAQSCDRVCVLCGRIQRDIALYEDNRDPQTLDRLAFQVDLLL